MSTQPPLGCLESPHWVMGMVTVSDPTTAVTELHSHLSPSQRPLRAALAAQSLPLEPQKHFFSVVDAEPKHFQPAGHAMLQAPHCGRTTRGRWWDAVVGLS